VVCFYFGIVFLALPISIMGANFEELYENQRQRQLDLSTQGLRRSLRNRSTSSVGRDQDKTGSQDVAVKVSQEIIGWLPRCARGPAHRLYLLLEDPSSSLLGRWYTSLSMCLIFISVISFVLESVPDYNYTPDTCVLGHLTVRDCEPLPDPIFFQLETVCIAVFTVDYIFRVLTVHAADPEQAGMKDIILRSPCRQTWAYCLQAANVVDLLAILPYYLEFFEFEGGAGGGMAVFRVTRLVRIFRLLKMPKMRSCIKMFALVLKDTLPALVLVVFLTMIIALLFAAVIVFAEGTEYSVEDFQDEHPEGAYVRPSKYGYTKEVTPFRCIVYSLWWFFVTATTVGYGDDVPTTTIGRLTCVLAFYVGLVLLALPITAIGNSFNVYYPTWIKDFRQMQTNGSGGNSRTAQRALDMMRSAASHCNCVSASSASTPRDLEKPSAAVGAALPAPTASGAWTGTAVGADTEAVPDLWPAGCRASFPSQGTADTADTATSGKPEHTDSTILTVVRDHSLADSDSVLGTSSERSPRPAWG